MAMREFGKARMGQPLSLGETLKAYVEALGFQARISQTRVIDEWELIVGTTVARRTRRIWTDGPTLHVELTSAPLKAQMRLSRTRLLEMIAERVGRDVITNVMIY